MAQSQGKNKVIEVNANSLIGLRAELHRKQNEFKEERRLSTQSRNLTTVPDSDFKYVPKSLKRSKIGKKFADVFDKSDSCEVSNGGNEEEDLLLSKVSSSLQAKSELYDAMLQKKSHDDINSHSDEESDPCLVDFSRKDDNFDPELVYKQAMHEKWHEQEDINMSLSQTHYEHHKFDEVRDHGVGYYKFSADAKVRADELKALEKLTEQTDASRLKRQSIVQKRKALQQERIAKVKLRRGIAASEEENLERPSPDISTSEPSDIVPSATDTCTSQSISKRLEEIRKSMSQSVQKSLPVIHGNFIEKERSDRNFDFAPPATY